MAAAARPPSSRAHAPASTSLQLDTSRSGRHAVASARGRVVGRVARASPATTYFLATEPAKKAPRAAAPLPDAMLRELQSRTAAMGGPRLEAGDAALRSTPKQRLVVALWAALELALACRVASDVSSPEGALCVAASLVAAFFAADLGSGLFHWATDNYGDKRTPVLGGVIDAVRRRPLRTVPLYLASHTIPFLSFAPSSSRATTGSRAPSRSASSPTTWPTCAPRS